MTDSEELYDCIVVGAGYAGLSTARHIADNDPSLRVLVLEARDRVGGRALTKVDSLGHPYDIGPAFLGDGQHMMYSLAKEYDVKTYRVPDKGKLVLHLHGETKKYSGWIPPIGLHRLPEVGLAIARFERKVKKIDPNAPWAHPKAAKWDKETVRKWIDRHVSSRNARGAFQLAFEAVMAAPMEKYSMLYALFVFRTLGGFEKALTSIGGLQQDLMRGGAMAIPVKIAESIESKVTIKLDEPVISVDYSQLEGGCNISTPKGSYRGRRIVFTVPPNLVPKVNFNPALPQEKIRLHEAYQAAHMIKITISYETPFWKKLGLRGECTGIGGLISNVFDVGYPDPGAPGHLITFICADRCEKWLTLPAEEKRRVVLDELRVILGEQAMDLKEFLWDESLITGTWGSGCPLLSPRPGTISEVGEWLRKPIGPIHWAGTETSDRHYGYMEGAVNSGRRAAEEVMEALKKKEKRVVNGVE
ncbi:flavin containing amine oxidoreductase domain-containing protein [Sarocladium implicatum]|nr:flavin containing amine oxidoreductase domain-containing protein [Sarocladium implicatum]